MASRTSDARLLRISEAARFLGCSVSSVYQLLRRGALHPLTLPGMRGSRFDRADLEALVEQAKQAREASGG